jgi:hypothetical protein
LRSRKASRVSERPLGHHRPHAEGLEVVDEQDVGLAARREAAHGVVDAVVAGGVDRRYLDRGDRVDAAADGEPDALVDVPDLGGLERVEDVGAEHEVVRAGAVLGDRLLQRLLVARDARLAHRDHHPGADAGERLLGGHGLVVGGDAHGGVAADLALGEPGAVAHDHLAGLERALAEVADDRVLLGVRDERRLLEADAAGPRLDGAQVVAAEAVGRAREAELEVLQVEPSTGTWSSTVIGVRRRCMWVSISPGVRYAPPASITVVPGPTWASTSPAATIVSPTTVTPPARTSPMKTSTTFPLSTASVASRWPSSTSSASTRPANCAMSPPRQTVPA